MINNDQSTLLLYCCEDVKSHRSGGDTVSLRMLGQLESTALTWIDLIHCTDLSNPEKI